MSEQLTAKSWSVALRAVTSDELEIAVYDVIGQSFFGDGVSAKDILAKLRSAPQSKKISLRINSIGGVVDEAKAMVNLLNERSASGVTIEATVDGIAASAASYLLTAASKVVMPANAFMMLHGVRGGARGTASDMEAAGVLFRRMNEQIAEAYAAASSRRGVNKTKDDYLASFAAGDLYLDADQAIAWGLADEKLAAVQVAACLADITGLDSAPDALKSAPYVIRPLAIATQAEPTPAPAPDASRASTSQARATGQRKAVMTKAEIKAQFPEAYASILEDGKIEGKAEGATSERKRVNAHLKMAKTCGAMDVAEKAIAAGLSLQDDEVMADYQTAAINRRDQASRQTESDGAGAVLAQAKTGTGAPAGAPGAAGEAATAVTAGEDDPLLVAAANVFAGKKA